MGSDDFYVRFDWRVFGSTAALTILTGILFRLALAVAAARLDLNHGLKEGRNRQRGVARG